MRILLIDNYDSFTFNIVELLRSAGYPEPLVVKNDDITIEQAAAFDKILLSPGPDLPVRSGILLPLLNALHASHSILGICLGHQAIVECFGGRLKNLSQPQHGQRRQITVTLPGAKLFRGIPPSFYAGLYHSWVAADESIPEDLKVTSLSDGGAVMSVQHSRFDVHGVQFHPESYMTEYGREILKNFIEQ